MGEYLTNKPFDILFWWQFDANKYKIVPQIAKDIIRQYLNEIEAIDDSRNTIKGINVFNLFIHFLLLIVSYYLTVINEFMFIFSSL